MDLIIFPVSSGCFMSYQSTLLDLVDSTRLREWRDTSRDAHDGFVARMESLETRVAEAERAAEAAVTSELQTLETRKAELEAELAVVSAINTTTRARLVWEKVSWHRRGRAVFERHRDRANPGSRPRPLR